MNRFVILYHELPAGSSRPSHWDLMLEQADGLLTWALDQSPAEGVRVGAVRLPDHRLYYLQYEGPVSGDRGRVTRWDGGTFERLASSGNSLRVRLHGERLRGVLSLQLQEENLSPSDQDAARGQRWSCSFEPASGTSAC